MEKVKVTKEVAEAIEALRKQGDSDEEILRVLADPDDGWATPKTEILNDIPFITVVKAVVIGYEVEETPEEKISKYYYEALERSNSQYSNVRHVAYGDMRAVKYTLDTLGISIKGVNT